MCLSIGDTTEYSFIQQIFAKPYRPQVALVIKNLSANAGDVRDSGFDPWVRKIPWRRKWQPTPVFLPGKSHRQRSLAGYSPWGPKESDMSEADLACGTHVGTIGLVENTLFKVDKNDLFLSKYAFMKHIFLWGG